MFNLSFLTKELICPGWCAAARAASKYLNTSRSTLYKMSQILICDQLNCDSATSNCPCYAAAVFTLKNFNRLHARGPQVFFTEVRAHSRPERPQSFWPAPRIESLCWRGADQRDRGLWGRMDRGLWGREWGPLQTRHFGWGPLFVNENNWNVRDN